LFWGPPGSGKTSLAGLYVKSFSCPSIDLHPTRFHAADVKKVLDEAASSPLFRPTIMWIDEIHRLTRPQQDMLLRGVEEGSVALVAATTENPSFVLSNALLSRLTVLTFLPLQEQDLSRVCEKVLTAHPHLELEEDAKRLLLHWASGDARKLLSSLEVLVEMKQEGPLDVSLLQKSLSHHAGSCIAEGEGRYILISALHKAVRGSDCQASLYWFSRLLHAGEDPLYIARRLLRMATEDIGLADPQALSVALNGQECFKALGSPEGELALAEVVIYLALCPKSAASYVAFGEVKEVAKNTAHLAPPAHIVNAPTSWMKKQGFGAGYMWDHEMPDAFSGQNYFPEGVQERDYYVPVSRGFERELEKRMAYFQKLKAQRQEEGEASGLPP
jgi:putative ATPase